MAGRSSVDFSKQIAQYPYLRKSSELEPSKAEPEVDTTLHLMPQEAQLFLLRGNQSP